jgi:hypothetical protein
MEGIQPIVVPHHLSDITVMFFSPRGDEFTLVERRRLLGSSATTGVDAPVSRDLPGIEIRPNPLTRGSRLQLSGTAPADAEWLDVFDLAGRRVAAVHARRSADRFEADLDPSLSRGWSDGVYFVRLRGTHSVARFALLR